MMAKKYHVTMDGNNPILKEMSLNDRMALSRKMIPVEIALTKDVLQKLKKISGIKSQASNRNIVHAFITKVLNDGTV